MNGCKQTACFAGPVVLQDLWLPNRAGGTAGAQEGCSTTDEEEEVLWGRHSGCLIGRRRLCQVSLVCNFPFFWFFLFGTLGCLQHGASSCRCHFSKHCCVLVLHDMAGYLQNYRLCLAAILLAYTICLAGIEICTLQVHSMHVMHGGTPPQQEGQG